MNIKTYLKQASKEDITVFIARLGTSLNSLNGIAYGHRKPSFNRAKKMVSLEPRLTLHELRPDIWEAPEKESA